MLGTVAENIVRWLPGRTCIIIDADDLRNFPLRSLRLASRSSIVHFLSPQAAFQFSKALESMPQIVAIHHVSQSLDRDMHRLGRTHRIVTMSMDTMEQLRRKGIHAELMRYGVDSAIFAPNQRQTARSQLGLPQSGFILGWFAKETSNSSGRKGVEELVKCATAAHNKFPLGVLLTGEGFTGLEDDLSKAGIKVYRRPCENAGAMPVRYNAVDSFICTSRVEGGPLTVLEAMSCARPVISTRVGYAAEAIVPGVSGIVVEPGDWVALASAIESIHGDETKASRLGQQAREEILERWQWYQVLEALPKLYDQTQTSGKQRPTTLRLCRTALGQTIRRYGSTTTARWRLSGS